MPKVELHVHLEGTIGPGTLWKLAQNHGIDLGIATEADLPSLYDYDDFPGFIDVFTRCSDCLRDAADLGMLVDAYGDELARQHVRYAEIHYIPEPHLRRKNIPLHDGLDAMNQARRRVLDRHGIELRWIADGVRDAANGPQSVDITVDWIIEAGEDSGIVALGLGGNEIGHPARDYRQAFERAHKLGINVVAHAGEAVGPESIWETLDQLLPARIGHGIAAGNDPALMEHLAATGIPLEICPTSNLRTGVVSSYDSLPLRRFHDAGVAFSINSDDPPMFGTDLLTEYAIAMELLNLDRQGVANLVASAIDQSFAPAEVKSRLHEELRAHTPLIAMPAAQ
jgi:adenosine deaminase